MINVYCSKIPMSWISTVAGKVKFLEFKNAKEPKATIKYGVRQVEKPGMELSNNFDKIMISALKKVGGIKSNMIIVKGINTSFSGSLWLKPQDGCEIIVLDGIAKKPIFREVVNGVNDYSKNKTIGDVKDEEEGYMIEENDNKSIIGKIIKENNTGLEHENDENEDWINKEYDSNGNLIYCEDSNGYWEKQEYDSNGNIIYYESSNGDWSKYEYDSNGNRIYFECSNGYWEKREYDSNGKKIYFENSYGTIEDKRNKEINKFKNESKSIVGKIIKEGLN